MAGRHRRRSRKSKLSRLIAAVCAVALVLALGGIGAWYMDTRMDPDVTNAGMQLTDHTGDESVAQVFMNGRWHKKRDVETLLVIGIDNYGDISASNSYNNTNQADFLALFIRDNESGESSAIHINRDTITDITMLGVTGEAAGTQRAQLALAYNYGQGQNDSSRNTADAVSRLLYGIEIDHYITVTMDAVPVMNDWAGGVTLEIKDDMTGVDSALVLGEEIKLTGEQALAYVRTRKGLDDSSNIHRMERQRQFASAWVDQAREQLGDSQAVAQLVMQMSDYHYSDCTADQMAEFAQNLAEAAVVEIHELPGQSVRGEQYMEFYADDEQIQQLVLDIFYMPTGN